MSFLEGDVPGSAAYLAAQRLLTAGAALPESCAALGRSWNAPTDAWSVDHAAAMRLWSPPDGFGLPPMEMVDAFLASYAERTGDDSERPLIEELYEEARAAASHRGGVPERLPATTHTEAVLVADRYGYREFVKTVVPDSSSRGFGTVVGFAALLAFSGVLLVTLARGAVLALVGGVLLTATAVGVLTLGVVARRRPGPPLRQLFMFTHGVVVGVDGVADAYAWRDLELVDKDAPPTLAATITRFGRSVSCSALPTVPHSS